MRKLLFCQNIQFKRHRRKKKLLLKQNKILLKHGAAGGAKVLGKLPLPGRPLFWITVWKGPIALAVGAGGDFWTFFSFVSFSVSGRRPNIY